MSRAPYGRAGGVGPNRSGPNGSSGVVGLMFRGQFDHAIDEKGRTSLPSRFRDVLGAEGDLRLVVTPSRLSPCLDVYPMKVWEELEAKLAPLSRFDPKVVAFRRRYISAAVECELDKQGRILIPPSLREHAGLVKDVVWAGMGQTAELWAKDRWIKAMSDAEGEDFQALIEQFHL